MEKLTRFPLVTAGSVQYELERLYPNACFLLTDSQNGRKVEAYAKDFTAVSRWRWNTFRDYRLLTFHAGVDELIQSSNAIMRDIPMVCK